VTETQRRLRAARAYAGLTIDELAERIGVGRQTIVRNERGDREPKRMEIREIADACDLPLQFFSADLDLLNLFPDDLTRDGVEALRIRTADGGSREMVISGEPFADVPQRGPTATERIEAKLDELLNRLPARPSREDQDASLREADRLRQEEPSDEGQEQRGRRRA
jgi:transcriptional regulator with XRE-family HTH domain